MEIFNRKNHHMQLLVDVVEKPLFVIPLINSGFQMSVRDSDFEKSVTDFSILNLCFGVKQRMKFKT